MRIAIVDDEPSLIRLSAHTISDYGKERNINIEVDEFPSGEQFLESYTPGTYSIIFMDVYMQGLSGIETVNRLRVADNSVAVIFLTTSESHMKEALSCHAFDYLTKPATRTDFFKVLDECIAVLGDKIINESKYLKVRSRGLDITIFTNDIMAVTSNGHMVSIFTRDGSEYTSKQNFSTISDMLSVLNNIVIINRGILVNMDYIDRFDECDCYLKNGLRYAVKVKASKQIRQTYENYKITKKAT